MKGRSQATKKPQGKKSPVQVKKKTKKAKEEVKVEPPPESSTSSYWSMDTEEIHASSANAKAQAIEMQRSTESLLSQLYEWRQEKAKLDVQVATHIKQIGGEPEKWQSTSQTLLSQQDKLSGQFDALMKEMDQCI